MSSLSRAIEQPYGGTRRGRKRALQTYAKLAAVLVGLLLARRKKLPTALPALLLLLGGLWSARAPQNLLQPPGGPASLPLLGGLLHLPEIFRTGLAKFFSKYSRLSEWASFDLTLPGGQHVLILNDERDRKHVLRTNWRNYQKNMDGFGFDMFFEEVLGRGIFATDGEEWKNARRAASHMFAASAMESQMEHVFVSHARALAAVLREKARTGETFDLQNLLQAFTFDTMSEIAFGSNPKGLECAARGGKAEFLVAFDECQRICLDRMTAGGEIIWQTKRFFGIGDEGCLKRHVLTLDATVSKIVADRRSELDGGEGGARNDLLTMFIAHARRIGDESLLTDARLRDVILNFMIAGRDTTACASTNLLKLLHANPRVAGKLKADLSAAVGGGGSNPTLNNLRSAEYADVVFSETVRLFPPVSIDARFTVESDTLPSGIKVHPGVQVTVSNLGIGRNPALWGQDADEFRPERWFERTNVQKQSLAATGSSRMVKQGEASSLVKEQYTLPAFWAGPRLCLGKDMARFEAKVVAYVLLVEAGLKIHVQPVEEIFTNAPVIFYKGGVMATVSE